MALVRVNPPGQPVRYIDLGIARGRVSVARGAPIGGPIVAVSYRAVQERHDAPLTHARCDRLMPQAGLMCGRRAGHHDDCRTPEAVRKDTLKRKARKLSTTSIRTPVDFGDKALSPRNRNPENGAVEASASEVPL